MATMGKNLEKAICNIGRTLDTGEGMSRKVGIEKLVKRRAKGQE